MRIVSLLSLFITLLSIPLVATSQQLHIGLGPSFSIIRPPGTYDATMIDAQGFRWPKEVKVISGQKSDKGYCGLVRMRFKLPGAPISVLGGFSYTRVVGASERVQATPPPWSSLMYESGRLETKADLLSVSAGARWDILRIPVVPYLFAAVAYNRTGETSLTITAERWQSKAVIDAMSRTGAAFGAGVGFALQPLLHVEVELSYAMLNAFGREGGEPLQDAASLSAVFSFRMR